MMRTTFTRRAVTTSFAVGLLLLTTALAGCGQKADSAAKDEGALQGTWQLTAGQAEGRALTTNQLAGGRLVINGERYTLTLADGETTTGVQTLDPTKSPKAIDVTATSGPDRGKTWLGIYDLKGDEFRIALAPNGRARPTSFATAPDSGHWMHVWKRAK